MANATSFVDRLDRFVDSHGDPYGNTHLPGASWNELVIVVTYLIFVLKVGPAFMRNRKPLQLEGLMRVYNALNVLINFIGLLVCLPPSRYTLDCWTGTSLQSLDNGSNIYVWGAIYGFRYLKIFDLLDTVFFVLRKKDRQVTMLHLVHHSIMPFTTYYGMKMAPYAALTHFGFLNSTVHTAMYSYYFLASYGPKMQPFLWWKRYITEMQLIQFAINLAQAAFVLMTCDLVASAKLILYLQLVENLFFFYAFGKFYVKEYKSKPSGKDKSE